MERNVPNQSVAAGLVSKSTGDDITSGTTAVYITGDNGDQFEGQGTVTHKGNGCWVYVPDQDETDFYHIVFTFVNANAVTQTRELYTRPINSQYQRINVDGSIRIDPVSAISVVQQIDESSDLKSVVDSIDGRTVPALVSGRVPSDIVSIGGETDPANKLKEHAKRAVPVTFSSGGTVTTAIFATVDGDTANAVSDLIYKNAALVFSAPAALKDQRALIQSYDAATKTATITQVSAAVDETAVAILV